MKKVLIVLLLAAQGALAQKGPVVSFGHVDTLHSNILGEDRRLLIYEPPHDTAYFSKPAYPVLYLLDGDGYFAVVTTLLQQLSYINDNKACPEMIVVGITNTDRNRDLAPVPDSRLPHSGGGAAFLRFMQEELIPYIDQHYATAPYRVLAGHSLGGLTVLNALVHAPQAFQGYIATEPSVFCGNEWLLHTLRDTALHLQQHDLYLGVANTLYAGMDTAQAKKDTSLYTYHFRAILAFRDYLKQHPESGLQWAWHYYPDDNHSTSATISLYDGLRFIFRDNPWPHQLPVPLFQDTTLSNDALRTMLTTHFTKLAAHRGYPVKPSEPLINQMAYTCLQMGMPERAKMFFQLNIDYYPESFNVYDGMGDYYMAVQDKAHAKAYWKKALSLKFTDEINKKLQAAQ
ncbi:esterase [Chitinophaga parva]|uniref:Esterase n=1 Tax=Chitinophaga parva TaxID=2169414 RepID=A0A2T7BHB5_9BACT|nr:alpha/beta hydrolase-fold protein [Chitinophaga parva]PUZ25670.1 esterase [Chitinophaga parva]